MVYGVLVGAVLIFSPLPIRVGSITAITTPTAAVAIFIMLAAVLAAGITTNSIASAAVATAAIISALTRLLLLWVLP